MKLRGDITDILAAVVIFLVASIVIVLAFYLSQNIQPQLVATLGANYVNPAFSGVNQALAVLANGAVFVYIGTNLMAIVAAYFVKSHPILVVAAFMILLVEILFANIAVSVFQSIIQTSVFVGIGNVNIPFIVMMFKLVPVAVFIFGCVLMFLQYGKSPSVNASV